MYSHSGDVRAIEFNDASLSIITGESKTGKSALIHIIDYCLGSGECHVPQGVIRRKAAWYAVVLFDGANYLFVARRNPTGGKATSSEIDVRFQDDSNAPSLEDLAQNSTIDSLKATLSRYVGLAENLFVPPEGYMRPPLEANFSHSRIYCFQDQSLIDNKNQLFFNQQDSFVAQAIKDTLPFFVGAVSETELQDQLELNQLKRDLRVLERQLEAAVTWEEASLARANALLAEARQVNLLPLESRPTSPGHAFELLVEAAKAPLTDDVSVEERTEFEELSLEREALRSAYFDLGQKVEEALLLGSSKDAYQRELGEQSARLKALSIVHVEDDGTTTCPLCESHVPSMSETLASLQHELSDVTARVSALHQNNPRLQTYVAELRGQRRSVESRLSSNQAQINAVLQQQEVVRKLREERVLRSRVQGRISSFLENRTEIDDAELKARVELIRYNIEQLESKVGGEAFEERLRNAESNIADFMTTYARILDLEHSEGRTRLDFRRLTVVADTPNGAIRLDQMGSGDNWVGCHVIAHIALHRWFRLRDRPVPAFLVLDQPSKAHYPPSDDQLGELMVEDDDRKAVVRLFKFLHERAAETGFQIIVVDHADESEEWFQTSVIERWRGGEKLIPDHWPEA